MIQSIERENLDRTDKKVEQRIRDYIDFHEAKYNASGAAKSASSVMSWNRIDMKQVRVENSRLSPRQDPFVIISESSSDSEARLTRQRNELVKGG